MKILIDANNKGDIPVREVSSPKIVIDANEANVKNRVGIGRYAFNVLKGLYERSNSSDISTDFEILLKSTPLTDLPKETPNWEYKVLNPPLLWTQIALSYYLTTLKSKPQILFSLSHYAPLISHIPSVISIMDLSYLHYPELFRKSDLLKLKYLTYLSAKKAKKIITISEFSKKEIIKHYNINPNNIIVAYPGVDTNVYNPKPNTNTSDFILFVGTLQPRKNIIILIEAFSKLNNNNLKLKIVGKKGWLYDDIFTLVNKLNLQDRVLFANYVSEKELTANYQKALCLVLPSFYEGFGIPVVEAFVCGCPVIVANTSSLPEITAGAALVVQPDSDSLALAINKIYKNKKLAQTLIKKGLERAKTFSWEKTANIIYTTLIKEAKIQL